MAAIAEAAGLPFAAMEGKSIDVTSFQNPAQPDALPLLQVQKAGLLHRADIRRTLLEYEAADARLRLALANQYPNVTLSPAWTFQEGFPAYTLGSILESLPVFHRNQGPIAEQEAARRQVAAQFKALQARILGAAQTALLQYRAAMKEWLTVRDTFLQTQRQREAAVLSSFRAGESDRLDVTQSRLLTLTAQKAQADALSRVQVALGALEDAMQSPLQEAIPAPRPETTN
jgi:outer membrane protein TolC